MISFLSSLRFLRAVWCVAMVAVTVLAFLPAAYLQLQMFSWWDKAQHALAFAVLTGLCLLAWPGRAWRVLLGMVAYGALIEWAQYLSGWRVGELADLVADAVGVALAWLLVRCLRLGKPLDPGSSPG